MLRRIKHSIILIPLLVLLVSTGWILGTQSGLLFILDFISSKSGLNIAHQELQGTLIGRIRAENLTYEDKSVVVHVEKLDTGISLFWLLDPQLAFEDTNIENLTVNLKESDTDESQTTDLNVELPIEISFQSLVLKKLIIARPASTNTEINDVNLMDVHIDKNINFEQIAFSIEQSRISLSGEIGLTEEAEIDVEAAWELSETEKNPFIAGTSLIEGNLKKLDIETEITKPQSVTIQAKLRKILSAFNWRATVRGEVIELSATNSNTALTLKQLNLNLKGDIKTAQLTGTSELSSPDIGQWNSTIDAEFSAEKWSVNGLKIESTDKKSLADFNASSVGENPYSTKSGFKLKATWNNLQWPLTGESEYSSERGSLNLSGSLEKYSLSSSGHFAFGDFSFSDITLNGAGNSKSITLDEAKITYLDGLWTGNAAFDWSKGFTWTADLNVKGGNPAVQWQELPGKLDGNITANGNHQPDDWEIKGKISGLTGEFKHYPVKADSEFRVNQNEYAFTKLRITSDKNQLNGGIIISNYLGNNEIAVQSNWNLEAKDLALLINDTSGSLISEGKLEGSLSRPIISASVSASQLKFSGYEFNRLEVQANANLFKNEKLKFNIKTSQASVKGISIDSLEVNTNGKTYDHNIVLDTRFDTGNSLKLKFEGGYKNNVWKGKLKQLNVKTLKSGNWDSSVPAKLEISQENINLPDLCLQSNIESGKICLSLASQAFETYSLKTNIRELPISSIKGWLPEEIVSIKGNLNGNAEITLKGQQIKHLNLDLKNDSGSLTHTFINNSPRIVNFRDIGISLRQQKNALQFVSNIDFQKLGKSKITLLLPDVHAFENINVDQKIQGEVKIDVNDLSLLPVILPEVQSIEGSTSSLFTISGTLGNPNIVGTSDIIAREIALPKIGLKLETITLHAYSNKDRSVHIKGTAESGDGSIDIKGEIPDYTAESLNATMEISGERFLAVKLPDIEMEMSPKLKLSVEKSLVKMEGDINIDRAQISIIENVTGLSPSNDVVIVDQQEKKNDIESYKLEGNLNLKFSERVYVRGAGFVGRIEGSVKINEVPGRITLATGELTIKEGRYTSPVRAGNIPALLASVAQKELYIDGGKLIFSSSPIDNPRLNIRAQRTVKKVSTGGVIEDEEIIVGVEITGHVRNPQISLFSEPSVDQADILAYLTLGYPFAEASKNDGQYLARVANSIGLVGGEKLAKNIAKKFGIDEVYIQSQDTTQQASLVLGKYLSPKLYVRYAVGIGEAVDTLQIQYKLTDRLVIRTESAVDKQGADLIYSIDKD